MLSNRSRNSAAVPSHYSASRQSMRSKARIASQKSEDKEREAKEKESREITRQQSRISQLSRQSNNRMASTVKVESILNNQESSEPVGPSDFISLRTSIKQGYNRDNVKTMVQSQSTKLSKQPGMMKHMTR